MAEQESRENQKTVVAFAAGLLIGGLLVWVFGGAPKSEAPKDTAEEQNTTEEINIDEMSEVEQEDEEGSMQIGDGKIVVVNQKASNEVALESAVFPTDEGWIGVRDYVNGQPAGVLGAARYSKVQGLVPSTVVLQRATVAGKMYALVFYSESGDRVFSLADDKQIGGVVSTFTAN